LLALSERRIMETKRVYIELDCKLWKRFHKLAIQEETKIHILFNEAMALYLKFLLRQEIEDRKEAGQVQEATSLQIEQLETQRIIEAWRREKIGYEKRKFWAKKKVEDGRKYKRGKYKEKLVA